MNRNPAVLQARKRNLRISIEKKKAGVDGFGQKTVNVDWREETRAWAGIAYGGGGEQREAAQQGGSQTATFYVGANEKTRATSVKDRIRYPLSDPDPRKWPTWEIQAKADLGFNEGFAFTATRVSE